jgi:hypothetical protein
MNDTFKFLVFTAMAFLIITGCTNTVRYMTSQYHQQTPAVDANLAEWKGQLRYDARSRLHYGVRHDGTHIYLALQARDPVVQRKIMAFGLTVYYDTTGNREKRKGIRYPVPVKEKMPVRESSKEEDLPLRAKRARPELSGRFLHTTDKEHMVLINFEGQDKQKLPIGGDHAIEVQVRAKNSSGVTYEARVPIQDLFGDQMVYGQALSIGIETGYLDVEDSGSSRRGPGSMIPYGDNRKGGQSNGTGFRGEAHERLREPTVLWLKGVRFSR